MSSPTSAVQLELPLFATVASVQTSSEMTLPDKLNLCENDIQKPKSSKTSALDSISKGKDCKPYWSDLCAEISSKLLLPVETGCADSDLNYSSSWSNKTVEKSWFSQTLYTVLKPNSQRIFLPSFRSSVAGCTDSEATARKSRKIRIFLNPEQKALLKRQISKRIDKFIIVNSAVAKTQSNLFLSQKLPSKTAVSTTQS